MKQEKFNISIEREALRLNKKNELKTLAFPKAFGKKEKNNFITAGENENVLVLKTPVGSNIIDIYNKLEEITNVVYVECYNLKEVIWPFAKFDNIELSNKITLNIDKEFYEEIKKLNTNLPEKLEEAYQNLKKGFKQKQDLFEKIFGKYTLKISKNNIEISNIKPNYKSRNTITIDQVYFIVTLIFRLLEPAYESSLVEEQKELLKIAKLYQLKSLDSVKNIISEIKDKKSITEENVPEEEKISLAHNFMQEGYDTRYCLQKYQKIVSESVVLIKNAISQGINYNVLNENKSLVELDYNGHKEFVIEGNKTDRDTYIFPIITDDKFTSKQIMKEAGLNVPTAILLDKDMDENDIDSLVSPFYNKQLVVKPRNTNYGTGITVFAKKASKNQIMNAIEYAFKFDNNILIEEYIKGMEYRFLVVNGKCLSIAHRRTASVVGDGKSTIKELIMAKNKEPWHFLTGTPVKMDDPVVEFLKLQNLNYDSIIPEGQRIFLRTNSNCSTGGESVDMTPIMPSKFKRIAEKAAKAFNGKICGVDIIINDLEKDDYAIIEINDNPGYSINEWPYEGKGEKIGIAILNLLNLVQE